MLVRCTTEDNNFYATNTVESPGCIIPFSSDTLPAGFLLCDGSAISRTTYSVLFGLIGTLWGAGNGTTTFNIPNCSSSFFRGKDTGVGTGAAGRDAGGNRAIGNAATSTIKRPASLAIDGISHSLHYFQYSEKFATRKGNSVFNGITQGTPLITSGSTTIGAHSALTSSDTTYLPNCRPIKFMIKY